MKLVYFTDSYPFGLGEQWKANELAELVDHFETVTVVPFSYGGNFDHPKALPRGVTLKGPLFKESRITLRKIDVFKVIFNRYIAQFLGEFFRRRVYINFRRFVSWILGCLNVLRLMKHPVIREVLNEGGSDTVLYFYWGKGACEILPFTDIRRFARTFVRMHRFDLFEYENRNYIPFREYLLKSADVIAPSSLAGINHLRELYPQANGKIKLVRCGTKGNGKLSPPSQDGVLRVISCSLLSPVKRVHLMIDSLRFIDFPIEWYHAGDGALRAELEAHVAKTGALGRFVFKGMMSSETLLDYYTSNPFDVFVNTSSSEGVPFSIMEAFSAGIPVIATNAGGTGEIVDDATGRLLPVDITGEDLAAALTEFYQKTDGEKTRMRRMVVERYESLWNAEKLARELAFMLKEKAVQTIAD